MKDHTATTNYNQITDDVFVGSNFCCQVHFDDALVKQGVVADVSLEKEQIDAAYGVESYLWLPTEDTTAPSPHQLGLGCSHIQDVINRGHKVYIHCRNGHGRAPTMASAYLVSTGMSADDAMALIQENRAETHMNNVQIEAVRAFAGSEA